MHIFQILSASQTMEDFFGFLEILENTCQEYLANVLRTGMDKQLLKRLCFFASTPVFNCVMISLEYHSKLQSIKLISVNYYQQAWVYLL